MFTGVILAEVVLIGGGRLRRLARRGARTNAKSPADGRALEDLVDLRGLEPLTPSMRTRCATSCATGP